jgi:hypothetical protein
MGRNQDLRKRIAGYERIIARHAEKIRAELANQSPNEVRIAGWRREIRVWEEIVIVCLDG